MIVTTPAVVLQSRKQGETSKIVTLYTRDFGKLNVIAKGARKIKSKFGAALETFAETNAVFYHKQERSGLCLLSKAETIRSNAGILGSLERIRTASQVAELVQRAMHDEEENPPLFELLRTTFAAIAMAESEESLPALLLYFFLNFVRLSGFSLNLQEVRLDENSDPHKTELRFRINTAEIERVAVREFDPRYALEDDNGEGMLLLEESFSVLMFLHECDIPKVSGLRLSAQALANLLSLFSAFFSSHFAGMGTGRLRSGRPFGGY